MKKTNAITIDGVRYDYDPDPRHYCKTCALGDSLEGKDFLQRHGHGHCACVCMVRWGFHLIFIFTYGEIGGFIWMLKEMFIPLRRKKEKTFSE